MRMKVINKKTGEVLDAIQVEVGNDVVAEVKKYTKFLGLYIPVQIDSTFKTIVIHSKEGLVWASEGEYITKDYFGVLGVKSSYSINNNYKILLNEIASVPESKLKMTAKYISRVPKTVEPYITYSIHETMAYEIARQLLREGHIVIKTEHVKDTFVYTADFTFTK